MEWIFISPHLDDIALSCGGLVWELTQTGEQVSIWTICAGEPPVAPISPFAESLHTRWQTGAEATQRRRTEDAASCAILGAAYRHFDIPDCIYRFDPFTGSFFYDSEESLWGQVHPGEANLVEALSRMLALETPAAAHLIFPLALGGHVDHRLARAATAHLARSLGYYPDYPYALKADDEFSALSRQGWRMERQPISTAGLHAWQAAVAAHSSQISTFWSDLPAMHAAIRDYCQRNQGVVLWYPEIEPSLTG